MKRSTNTNPLAVARKLKVPMPLSIGISRVKALIVAALLLLPALLCTTDNAYAAARTDALSGGGNVASNMCSGTTNVIYSFQGAQGSTQNTLQDLVFTTTGTATAADITTLTLWWNTTNSMTGATQFGSISTGTGAGTHEIAGSKVTSASTTFYWFITATIAATGYTAGNTVAVSAIPSSSTTSATVPGFIWNNAETYTGTLTAGGTQTIIAGPSISGIPSGPICPQAVTTLTASITGGAWASSNTAAVTVTASGAITGVAQGNATISYSTSGCASPATFTTTVNSGPSAITVSPATSFTVCPGFSTAVTASAFGPTATVLVSNNFNATPNGFVGQVGGTWTVDNTGSVAVAADNWNVNASPGLAGSMAFSPVPGDGSPYAEAFPYFTFTGNLVSSLKTPTFSTVGYTSGTLAFDTYMESFGTSEGETAEIDYSTNGGASWTLLYNYETPNGTTTGSTSWTAGTPNQTPIAMPAGMLAQPNVIVRWYYISDDGYYWEVDNVVISGLPSPILSSGFTWTGPAGISCSPCSNPVLTPTITGTDVYTVSTTATGCSTTQTVTFTVPAPTPVGGNTPICIGGAPITLNYAVTGGTWSSGNTAQATIGLNSGVVSALLPGSPVITYTTPLGCTATGTLTINPAPNVSSLSIAAAGPYCSGLPAAFTISSGTLGNGAFTVNYSMSGANGTSGSSTLNMAAGSGTLTTAAVSGPGATVLAPFTFTNSFGCSSSSAATYAFNVSNPPQAISGPSNVCAGATIPLTDTGAGAWSSSNTAIATVAATGIVSGVSGGTPAITYTALSGCNTSAVITVNAVTPITAVPSGICTGQSSIATDATTGGTWSSTNTAVASIGSTGNITGGISAGATVISYTLPSGCAAVLPFGVSNTPTVFAVTGGGAYCFGGNGVHIGLSGSNPFVTYQLLLGGVVNVGSPVIGTGGTIDFGLKTAVGAYTVVANPGSACQAFMSGTATVSTTPLPTPYIISGGGTFCSGGIGYHITLGSSDFGVNYQLFNGVLPVGSPLAGVNGILTFPLQTTSGTYTITAVNATTSCTNNMTGSATVTNNPLPTPYIVTGGGSLCAGAPGVNVGLSNSDPGTSYQLFRGATSVGTSIGIGAPLNLGAQATSGTYTVVATTAAPAGCVATMTGSVGVTVNPLPTVANVTGGGAYCTGGAGVHIGLNGSQVGVNYQLSNSSATVGLPLPGTTFALDFGLQTATGPYSIKATNATTGCSSAMNGAPIVTTNPLPVSTYSVTGGGAYCTGGAGFPIGLSGSDTGVNYQLYNGGVTVGSAVLGIGSGSAITFGTITGGGTYTVIGTNRNTSCAATMTGSVPIIVNIPPPAFTVLGGGGYCIGGAGVPVVLNGSTVGVNYQLYNAGSTVGLAMPGTGTAINFGAQPLAGSYTIVATNPTTSCSSNMTSTATVTINPLPTIYSVSGGGGYCIGGTGADVSLNGSDLSVNYQLWNGATAVGSPMPGTGAPLDFGLKTNTVTYTATAVNSITTCSVNMAGSVTVTTNPLPAVTNITSLSNSYCAGGAGIDISLSAASAGINYQLYLNGSPVGTPVVSPADFGVQTAAGTYTAIATNATTGCSNNMGGSVVISITPLPVIYTVTGGGNYCIGSSAAAPHILLNGSASGVNYQLYNGAAIGGPVAGTGASIDFGTQPATGVYTVIASNPTTTCSVNMLSSASVGTNPLPAQHSVSGGGNYCAGGVGQFVGMAASDIGINYQLYNGSALGSPVPGTSSAFNFGLETASGTYTVVATNATTLCSSNMTGSATVTINPLPAIQTVTGGGHYCSGDTGVHVQLSGSASNTNYQLYNSPMIVGFPVTGTGAPIDFGAQLAGGNYTVIATDRTFGCTSHMAGSASVIIDPTPALYYVAGGGNYCPGGVGSDVLLNGSDAGISYQLRLAGVPAGSPVAGTGSFIDFGPQASTGVYTVTAVNMSTGCHQAMSGSVTVSLATPPVAYAMNGNVSYCPGGVGAPVSLAGSSAGVSYQLFHDGFMTGSAVSGTGSSLSFGPQSATGVYTIVATDSLTTCTSNMSGRDTVSLYNLPAPFVVSGGGSFCPGGSGVTVIIGGSETNTKYQLYANSLATGSPLTGTGASLNFGLQATTGMYTVVATSNATGCAANMTGTATVANYPLPSSYVVTGGGNYCTGGSGVAVSLAGSDAGINYQLVLNGATNVGGAVSGTGSGLNFGLQPAGDYTVVATNTTTGCSGNMAGTAAVMINPLPAIHTTSESSANYCAGGGGVDLFISTSDLGINYQLYRGGIAIGVPVMGTGSPIDFGMYTTTGAYTITAIDAVTGCSSNMAGTATISVLPAPTAYNVIGGGGYCNGGAGVHVGLDGSATGIHYQLMLGGTAIGSPVAGTGAAIDLGVQTTAGAYKVVATNIVSGCTNNMSGTATVVINPLPVTYTVTGGGSLCAGGAGVNIGLSGSGPIGNTYQLYRDGAWVDTAIAATGAALNFGPQTVAGNYTVIATNTTTSCTSNMSSSATVIVNSLPGAYTLTGGGSYCAGGSGMNIGLDGSHSNVKYQLYRGSAAVGAAIMGTGSPLNFGAQTTAGAYTVTATDNSTSCTSNMTGTATITINPLPDVNNVTGGGSYCPGGTGVHVGLSGSTGGINYQLSLIGGGATATITGTGSPLDFGLQTGVGSYGVVATNPATGCTSAMAGSADVTLGTTVTPSVSIATGVGDTVCSGTSVTFSATPVNGGTSPVYQWSVNGTAAGLGSAFSYIPSDGDNVSVSLASSAECPSSATVTSSLVMTVEVHALPTVAIAATPGTVVCQGTGVNYTAVSAYGGTAPAYTWIKNSAVAASGATYSYTPVDGDIITVQMNSNYLCRLENTVFSANTIMTVDSAVIPIVTITGITGGKLPAGSEVSLTASVVHGGPAPTYQWYINQVAVPGAVTATFTSNQLVNLDSVTCQVTSSGACSNLVGFNSVVIHEANVGVQQVTGAGADIMLMPNPNKGAFTVKGSLGTSADEEVSLEVYNMLGQVIYRSTIMAHGGNINEQIQLTGSLANGMYMLNVSSATQTSIFHFVIEQ